MTFEELQILENIKSINSAQELEIFEELWYAEIQASVRLSTLVDERKEELQIQEIVRD